VVIVGDGLGRGSFAATRPALGIAASVCASIAADCVAAGWLFAIGALTRPEYREVTTVREIRAHSRALAERLSVADMTRGCGI